MHAGNRMLGWICLGFAMLYLGSALIMSYMTQLDYRAQMEAHYANRIAELDEEVKALLGEKETEEQTPEEIYNHLCQVVIDATKSDYDELFYGVSIEDTGNSFRFQSGVTIRVSANNENDWKTLAYIHAEDILTTEEICRLAEMWETESKPFQTGQDHYLYGIHGSWDSINGQLLDICATERCYKACEEGDYPHDELRYCDGQGPFHQETQREEWIWRQENKAGAVTDTREGTVQAECSIYFPNKDSEDRNLNSWRAWEKAAYLQNKLADYASVHSGTKDESDIRNLCRVNLHQLNTSDTPGHVIRIMVACEGHPWMAAFHYLKPAFGYLLCFMMLCLLILGIALKRVSEKQLRLEQARRDFTNAMAHEVKTPISVVRALAENLQANVRPEKHDYYLDRIIDQTETIDHMVAEIIDVSKLDSDSFVLQKEPLELGELVQEQLKNLEDALEMRSVRIKDSQNPLKAENSITAPGTLAKTNSVILDIRDKFPVKGDRRYLEKAIWNLLDNAISYGTPEEPIRICITADTCTISNHCGSISREEMQHLGEMLHKGGRVHTPDGKAHLGMGLYLTRRILTLHHLRLDLDYKNHIFTARINSRTPQAFLTRRG